MFKIHVFLSEQIKMAMVMMCVLELCPNLHSVISRVSVTFEFGDWNPDDRAYVLRGV